MPYWSSRVGAVPDQGQASKQKKRSERFSRKGITMEDLKRQTALRLAQEQNRHGGPAVPGATPSGYGAQGTNNLQDPTQAVPAPMVHIQPRPNQGPASHQHHHHPQAYVAPKLSQPAQYTPPSQSYYQDASYRSHRDTRGDTSYSPDRIMNGRGPRTPPPTGGQPPSQTRPSNQSHYISKRVDPPNPYVDVSAKSNSNNKLPHGLTVQELKEMTKARLQAEAAGSKPETNNPQYSDGASVHSDESSRPSSRGVASSTSPVPPVAFQPSRSTEVPSPALLESAMHAQSHSSHHTSSKGSENWDNQTSSLSTTASDLYLLSEFPTVPRAPSKSEDFVNSAQFGHASAFKQNMSSNSSPHSSSDSSMMSEANRRRAATMSPRLTYPLLEGHESLGLEPPSIPSFNHTSSAPPSSYVPVNQSAFSVPFQGGNRQRTSSAASLPPMSHTADEFGLDASVSSNTISSSRFPSQFGAVREDAPVTTAGLAELFRVSSFDKSPSPFAAIEPQDPFFDAATTPTFHENRHRASTWSAPLGRTIMGSDDGISDDLASILKLSGAEEENKLS